VHDRLRPVERWRAGLAGRAERFRPRIELEREPADGTAWPVEEGNLSPALTAQAVCLSNRCSACGAERRESEIQKPPGAA
jgi:hypothetical protein